MKLIGGPHGHPLGDEDINMGSHNVNTILSNVKAAGQAGMTGAAKNATAGTNRSARDQSVDSKARAVDMKNHF